MTIHYIEPKKPKRPASVQLYKRKVLDVIKILRLGHAMSASQIAHHCDIDPYSASRTLELLVEYELVVFAGKGPQAAGGGHRPATWRWV